MKQFKRSHGTDKQPLESRKRMEWGSGPHPDSKTPNNKCYKFHDPNVGITKSKAKIK